MRIPLRAAIVGSVLAGGLLAPSFVHAEPSAWVAVGGGVLGWRDRVRVSPTAHEDIYNPSGVPTWGPSQDFRIDPTMRIEAGIGIPDRFPVLVGGVFRVTPLLAANTGADMAFLARVCTRGFQVGGFGVSLDAGAYARTWGTISQGFAGSVTFGAPLGIAASFDVMVGTHYLLGFGGTISIDLLRLTLYRKTFLNWWPNPEVETHQPPAAAFAPTSMRLF
ncbi:MAG: hypothetical protein U0441_31005 [Polyangiaceae bacterium]